MSPNAKGALISLLSFAIFATHDVVVKELGTRYAVFQIIFFSQLFSFPLVMLLLIRDPAPGTLRPVHPWWTALRTAAAVTTGFAGFYAFSTLPLAQVYALLFAAPLLVTILSIPILGEAVRLRRWLAVLVGLAGVFVVLRPGMTVLGPGHAAALLAAFGSALTSIVSRKIGRDERAVVMVIYPMLTNFAVMGVLSALSYHAMPVLDLGMTLAIAAMGLAASLLTIVAYRLGEAVIVAPMHYSQMLWAILFGALLFDEYPDALTLAGAAIIIASGLYIVLREGRSGASDNRPVLQTRLRFETGIAPRISALARILRRGP